MGMYLNDYNSYFIHVAGYSGKVANIFGNKVDVDFVKNTNFQVIEKNHPNGFSVSLSSKIDIGSYSIPFYNGILDLRCGDFYINVGTIFPGRKLSK